MLAFVIAPADGALSIQPNKNFAFNRLVEYET